MTGTVRTGSGAGRPSCPSDLALETHLLDEARSPHAAHVGGCEACRARLARMREEGEEFRQFVFPATVDAVERAAEKRRFRWGLVIAPIGALAAAAAVMLVTRVPGPAPAPDYAGIKGGELALTVFVDGGSGARAVEDGTAVPANAALRFLVRPAAGCWLWILSVDGSGQVSRLYPPKGTPPEKRAAGAVPGGAVLDGQAGPERIYAVCAPDERMAWSEVASSATGASGGAERVRAARALGGALAGAAQASVLVEKRP